MAAVGGVVLAGGASSRMGRPKSNLPWHGSTLLRRVTGLVARAVDGPVVVVRAAGQQLPSLPPDVRVVDDAEPGRGPLQGVANGLAAVEAEAAFVCATDMPFLHPLFVRRVASSLHGADVVLPVVAGYRQPLAAVYRSALASDALALLADGRSRVSALLDGRDVTVLDEPALLADPRLRAADPELRSVCGVDDEDAYRRAHDDGEPSVRVECFGVLASAGVDGPVQAAASTLGAAAAAVGLELDRHVLAAIGGTTVGRDPQVPLAQGDVVTFLSADAGG
jgi:molybdopterin-guanine dinucleotide biosynthesis protein A